jgi:hypothetical protein
MEEPVAGLTTRRALGSHISRAAHGVQTASMRGGPWMLALPLARKR